MRPSKLLALVLPLLLVSTSLAACLSDEDDEDTHAPFLDLLSPEEGTVLEGNNLVAVEAADASGIEFICFMVDDLELQNSTQSEFMWDTTEIDNGPHILEVIAADGAGNTARVSLPVILFNNLESPIIELINDPGNDPLNDPLTLTGKAADSEAMLELIEYSLGASGWRELWSVAPGIEATQWYLGLDPAALPPGQQKLQLRAYDGEHYSQTLELWLDLNHHPTADIVSPLAGRIHQYGQEIVLDASDSRDEDVLTYRWNSDLSGIIYEGNAPSVSRHLEPGTHTLTLTVDDGRGGTDTIAVEDIVVNIGPSLQVNDPKVGQYLRGQVTIEGTAWDPDDEVDEVELSLDGADWFEVDGTDEWEYIWDTTRLDDGTHTVGVRVSDTRKGVSEMEPQEFVVDNTPPEIEWPYGEEEMYVQEEVALEVEVDDELSGIEGVTFCLDGEEVQSGPSTQWIWDTGEMSDGDHTITAEAVDRAGNRAGTTELAVKVDNQEPRLTWLSPLEEYLGGEATLEVEVEETGSGLEWVAFAIEDEEVANGTATGYTWDTTDEADGPEYLLEVWAADRLGHMGYLNMTVFVDNTPPEIRITSPEDGKNTTGLVTVATSVAENGSGVARYAFNLDGDEMQNGSAFKWDWDTTLAFEGRHEVRVICWDRAGNWDATDTVVYLDHTPPEVSNLLPADGSELEGTYTVTLEALDLGSGMDHVEFYLDAALMHEDASAPWQWTLDTTEHSDGNHSLMAWAYDRAGNRASLAAVYLFGEQEAAVVNDPHTNFLSRYDVQNVERINLDAGDWAVAPYLAPLVPNYQVYPSIDWDGQPNPKETLEPGVTNIGRFSGEIALSYWQEPERAIVVDSYARALLMGPLAGMANLPLLLYDSTYTDEALYKLGTIYAPQIIVCGNTPYNSRGVTVLEEDEVLQFTLEYARYIDHDVDYLVATNPDDDLGVTTPHISALASAWAAYYGGVLITVPASATEMDNLIHQAYTEMEANSMTPRFLNIVGDEKAAPQMNVGGTPSDNTYADLDDDRFTVEVANGRMLDRSLGNLSHTFDRIVNYQDYLNIGTLRATRTLDYTAWANNAVIYMGWAAEFAEDSENQCRERMWAEGQFNTQDDTDKAHGGQKAAMMLDFSASNYVIINADHGAPSSTVTWDATDLPYFHPAIFFGVSCSVGRIDVGNPKGTITYTAMERGVNAWLAPTRTAYGSWIQTYPYQPIAAPGLCYLYLILMMNNDLTSGEAYAQAKNELIANGIGGDIDQVTTWQYQHYGDPGFNPYEPVNEGGIL